MDEVTDPIAQKVQALSDIELAVLLCLVVDQHCIIETDAQFLDGLEKELGIVRSLTWLKEGMRS
jgi:adenylate kinase